MAEKGYRTPASSSTAVENLRQLEEEEGSYDKQSSMRNIDITGRLRAALSSSGLKGFKHGGRVRKTGIYKLHKGEMVLTASEARHRALRKALDNG